MKLLPCEHCRDTAWVKIGRHEEPLAVGRVRHFPYRYKCSKCKRLSTLDVLQYNRLADIDLDELVRLGIVKRKAETTSAEPGPTK